MAYPTKPELTYDYSAFAQSQGDNSFPGSYLDIDLANVKASLDETIEFLKTPLSSDGQLKVGSTLDSVALNDATVAAQAAQTAAEAARDTAISNANAADASADAAASAAAAAVVGKLTASNNLSDLTSVIDARTNLGLGTAATTNATAYATAAQGTKADAALPNAAGVTIQTVNTQTGAVATTTTVMPFDDTIPQITEGAEFMTLSITPTSASNKLRIEVVFNGSCSTTSYITAALFKDAGASALASASKSGSGGTYEQVVFSHWVDAGSTSAQTFRVRAGQHTAGTLTFNGDSGARRLGGVMSSSITITEVKA